MSPGQNCLINVGKGELDLRATRLMSATESFSIRHSGRVFQQLNPLSGLIRIFPDVYCVFPTQDFQSLSMSTFSLFRVKKKEQAQDGLYVTRLNSRTLIRVTMNALLLSA
jgi:hypothetical protein